MISLLAERYRRMGRQDLSLIHQYIHFDEVVHAKLGVEWSHLLSNDPTQLLISLEKRFSRAATGGAYFVENVRKYVGFSDEEIDRQRANTAEKDI